MNCLVGDYTSEVAKYEVWRNTPPCSLVVDSKPRLTRATLEESTAGLGELPRAGRPPVGGLSFHDVSGLCTNSLARVLPGGSQAQGMRRRPMQALVSCPGGRTTACDPHARVGNKSTHTHQHSSRHKYHTHTKISHTLAHHGASVLACSTLTCPCVFLHIVLGAFASPPPSPLDMSFPSRRYCGDVNCNNGRRLGDLGRTFREVLRI